MGFKITNPYLTASILTMGGVDMGFVLIFTAFTFFGETGIGAQYVNDKPTPEANSFTAIGYVGALIGSLLIHPFVGVFGKRWCCFVCAFFGTLAWIVLGLELKTYAWVYAFRFFTGMTAGLYATICPGFTTSLAPEGRINLFGFLNQVGICIGFILVTVFGIYFKDWHYVSLACCFPSAILFLFVLLIEEPKASRSAAPCFQVFKYWKELIIAFFCVFFLQFSGVNAVASNLGGITAGMGPKGAIISIMSNVVNFLGTLVSSLVVDRFGNFPCWTVSALGQFFGFILLVIYAYKFAESGKGLALFLVGLYFEQFFFGIGTGPIPFSYAATIFKPELIPAGMAFTSACNWGSGAILLFLNAALLKAGAYYRVSYIFFAVFLFISMIFGLIVFRKKPDDSSKSKSDSGSGAEV
ncbi:Major Facilitator Superfamily protein [Trichomonas vaginalis G3]|uniref:Major Facilitator Superfamily protein n=1 Tax=Trichomonas vaginalis (strain ATCC PRA-98 / G3) TaxID=412133 RepID=A2DJU6_TRIV3|nr:major facilitator superfamily transporter [Trichomonas vaginalis G3]EAY19310.1 Major Facilitator Superfamily protein [Trichomonas vaginalis G3]KAI5527210.1 transmembrane transporter protein [Trichomonas vaginalis G3]|eukprot:XP_001580296.1 major facilitator superfamily transporter [Trichomonas vaginalis G3]